MMRDLSRISLDCSQRLTELLEFTLSPDFQDEMVVAREIFTLVSGKVNDDDFGYEQRMQLFQEFFLFEHRLSEPNSGYTIFELFLERSRVTRKASDLDAFESFRSVYRSLFLVERSLGDEAEVHDLIGRHDLTVQPLCSFSLGGIPAGQIFEGRVVRYQGLHFFTGAFIFHAPSVTQLVRRVTKNFLSRTPRTPALVSGDIDSEQLGSEVWSDFLRRRYRLLRGLQNKRDSVDQVAKKRAVDQLSLARSLADVYQMVSRPDGVTAIGIQGHGSCFVPENPMIQRTALLNALALCEVRSMRYRHIEPVKVYAQVLASDAEGLWQGLPDQSLGGGKSVEALEPVVLKVLG